MPTNEELCRINGSNGHWIDFIKCGDNKKHFVQIVGLMVEHITANEILIKWQKAIYFSQGDFNPSIPVISPQSISN